MNEQKILPTAAEPLTDEFLPTSSVDPAQTADGFPEKALPDATDPSGAPPVAPGSPEVSTDDRTSVLSSDPDTGAVSPAPGNPSSGAPDEVPSGMGDETAPSGADLPVDDAPVKESTAEGSAASEASVPAKAQEDPAVEKRSPEIPDIATIRALRDEVSRLRQELSERKALMERVELECAEFRELYPGVSSSSLPDDVLENVRRGVPLAAAYALSERRKLLTQKQAEESNRENSLRSSGALARSDPSYFTPDEVRAMSREEVRRHYKNILQSMQKWT